MVQKLAESGNPIVGSAECARKKKKRKAVQGAIPLGFALRGLKNGAEPFWGLNV